MPEEYRHTGENYGWRRCVQLGEQIYLARKLLRRFQSPAKVLELGPGEYELAGVLAPHVVKYDTINIDPVDNRATWHGDVRDLSSSVPEGAYDLVVACEVLEHMRMEDSAEVLGWLTRRLHPNGYLLVSVPILAVPLVVRRENDLKRAIVFTTPLYRGMLSRALFVPRFFYRLLVRRLPMAEAASLTPKPLPRSWHGHHWEVGNLGSSRRTVRAMMASQCEIVHEHFSSAASTLYFVLRPK